MSRHTAKAGHVPQKRPKIVEQVFGDCGEDFSSLMLADADPQLELLGIDPCPADNAEVYISYQFGLNGFGYVPS